MQRTVARGQDGHPCRFRSHSGMTDSPRAGAIPHAAAAVINHRSRHVAGVSASPGQGPGTDRVYPYLRTDGARVRPGICTRAMITTPCRSAIRSLVARAQGQSLIMEWHPCGIHAGISDCTAQLVR